MTEIRLRRAAAGLLAGAVAALIVSLMWGTGLFTGARLALTNFYYLPDVPSGNLVLVAIDDATLADYGALLGWDRSRYAQLTDTLTAAGARVVAYDLLFAEPNPGDDAFAAALGRARSAGMQTVLAVSGAERIPSAAPTVIYHGELRPVPVLAEAATHLAHVNTFPDPDGTVRTSASVGRFGDTERLSFSLTTYLAYFRVSSTLAPYVISITDRAVTLPPGVTAYTEDDGLWRHQFYDKQRIPVVSFRDVAQTPPETFAGKIVLVGLMNATGLVDLYPTPVDSFGEITPGMQVQAHAVETLLANAALRVESRLAEALTFTLLALATGLICAYARPPVMVAMGVGVLAVFGVYASVRFSAGVIVNPLHPALAVGFATLGSVGGRASWDLTARRRAENALGGLLALERQQLDLGGIVPLLVAEIRDGMGVRAGGVWLLDDSGQPFPVGSWGERPPGAELVAAVHATGTAQRDAGAVAVPVTWAKRRLCVFAAATDRPRHTQAQLERLAGRAAPNLDNALLYREVKQQNQLLTGVLTAAPSGMLVLDSALEVVQQNMMAAKWLSLPPLAEQPRPFRAVLAAVFPENDPTPGEVVDKLTAGAAFQVDLALGRYTYQLDAAPTPDGGRWVLTLSDVTNLTDISRLKTQMIRMASHDLKNPLGRMIGYSEMVLELAEENGHAEQYDAYLRRVVTSGYEMLALISEILDLERVRNGGGLREPLDLAALVSLVVERHALDMAHKSQAFAVDLPSTPLTVTGDFNQLLQAVGNLLGNAVKYTPDGGQINLRLYATDAAARIEVQDNGHGIPPEAQAKLFTEFYRVRDAHTRSIEGTGLGLSLVKAVVEAHAGRVWVESAPEVGSTFFVEIPLSEGDHDDDPT